MHEGGLQHPAEPGAAGSHCSGALTRPSPQLGAGTVVEVELDVVVGGAVLAVVDVVLEVVVGTFSKILTSSMVQPSASSPSSLLTMWNRTWIVLSM